VSVNTIVRPAMLIEQARFPEDRLVLPIAQRSRLSFGREPLIGALLSLLAYGLTAALVIPRFGAMTDALARVADASYVLFARGPHPEAIGFVWNPLPSLLAIPLVALKPLWPSLVREAIALNLVSALFGAVAVYYMLRIMRRLGLPRPLRWGVVALFALNPAVVFYAVNGMSDLMMGATMLAALDGLWGYLEGGRVADLLASGSWVAIGFLTRYEIAFWAIIVALTLAGGLIRLPRHAGSAHRYGDWIGGLLLFWLAPLICVSITWIFVNWTIMGDPLYFLRSAYGNTSSIGSGAYSYAPLNAANGSIGKTLAYVAQQAWLFPPVVAGLFGLLAFGLLGRYERHTRALVIVAATLAVPLLQLFMLYKGISAGWLRFFLDLVPFGFVSVVYTAQLLARRRGSGSRRLVWASCLLLLCAGDGGTLAAMLPSTHQLHYEQLQSLSGTDPVNAYIDAHPQLLVLTDSFLSFPILVRARQPKQFVMTSDLDFQTLLVNPFGRVDAFMVPRPTTVGKLDAINRHYPGLWQHGAPWAHLVTQFPGGYNWRLYIIDAPVSSSVRRPVYWFHTCVADCT